YKISSLAVGENGLVYGMDVPDTQVLFRVRTLNGDFQYSLQRRATFVSELRYQGNQIFWHDAKKEGNFIILYDTDKDLVVSLFNVTTFGDRFALASNAGYAFQLGDHGSTLLRFDLQGGEMLGIGIDPYPVQSMAADDTYLYWASSKDAPYGGPGFI